jgi:hypothetical protein
MVAVLVLLDSSFKQTCRLKESLYKKGSRHPRVAGIQLLINSIKSWSPSSVDPRCARMTTPY